MPALASARSVLVLGATSLIGRRLMLGAWPEDVGVTALSRAPPIQAADRASWIAADLADPDLATRLPRVDAVLSLSPIWLLPPALPALLATGADRIVAFSSTSRLTKIDSPVGSERIVARRLAEAEAALSEACDRADVGWTILRPTMIYAEGEDANVTRLARLIARFGVLPLAGRGGGLRQPVHAADLAVATWQALEAPVASGRAYDLPGGETLTYRQVAARIFEALGCPVRVVSLPPSLWRLGLMLARPLLPGATTAMGDRMERDLVFDASPAMRDLGYAPRPFRPDFSRVANISRGCPLEPARLCACWREGRSGDAR